MMWVIEGMSMTARLAQAIRHGPPGQCIQLRTRHDTAELRTAIVKSDMHNPIHCIVLPLEAAPDAHRELELTQWLWQQPLAIPLVVVGPAEFATTALRQGAAEVIVWPDDVDNCQRIVLDACRRFLPLQQLCGSLRERRAALARLTPRERHVLERLGDGWWIKRIAAELGTSPNTVRNQRAALLEKLELADEAGLLRLAQSLRWLEAVQGLHALSRCQAYSSSS